MTLKFNLYTLADITETRARKGEDVTAYRQQQNYLSVLQTIGLRVNPTVPYPPEIVDKHPRFGKKYANKNRVWRLYFEIDYEEAHTIELLKLDFNMVPFIDNLTETAIFANPVFLSEDKDLTNIVFEQIDK